LRVIRVHYQRQQRILRKRSSYPGAFHHRRILPQPCGTNARTSNPTAGDHQQVNAENKNDAGEDDASILESGESLMTNHYYAKGQTINHTVRQEA
jgi:hypothetical protein